MGQFRIINKQDLVQTITRMIKTVNQKGDFGLQIIIKWAQSELTANETHKYHSKIAQISIKSTQLRVKPAQSCLQ